MSSDKAYNDNLEAIAAKAFENATVRGSRAGTWIVVARGYTTYVSDLPGGCLTTFGNTSTVFYEGFYDTNANGSKYLLAKVRWAADSSIDYIASKVAGKQDAIYTIDHDVAVEDLAELERTLLEGHGDGVEAALRLGANRLPVRVQKDLDAIAQAREYLEEGDYDRMRREIAEEFTEGWEIAATLGRAIDARLFYSRAALRVLLAHLVERSTRDGRGLSDRMMAAEAALVRDLRSRLRTRPRYAAIADRPAVTHASPEFSHLNGKETLAEIAERSKLAGLAQAIRAIRKARGE